MSSFDDSYQQRIMESVSKHWNNSNYNKRHKSPNNRSAIMAKPVKDTPVLTGKNARHFDKWMQENQEKKISPQAHARIKAASKKFTLVDA